MVGRVGLGGIVGLWALYAVLVCVALLVGFDVVGRVGIIGNGGALALLV